MTPDLASVGAGTGTARRRPLRAAALLAAALAALSPASAAEFELHSPTFDATKPLPSLHLYAGFGCSGENRSPALEWSGAPAGTRSFALTLYDPDAPTGSGWWHWIVYDLPGSTRGLPADAGAVGGQRLPAAARMGRTDFGTAAFGGACPPAGDPPHRYVLTLHALKTEHLDVPPDASGAMIGFAIHAAALGSTSIVVRFGR